MSKVTFADEARAETGPKSTGFCRLATWMLTLTKGERTDIDEALAMSVKSISNAAIKRVLDRRYGFKVNDSTIANHRNGKCCCVNR